MRISSMIRAPVAPAAPSAHIAAKSASSSAALRHGVPYRYGSTATPCGRRGRMLRRNVEPSAAESLDPAGRPQVPLIRTMLDQYRGKDAKQVAQDISQLLAVAAPNLHVEGGAYFWLTCNMWDDQEPRITVHLLQRDDPSSTNLLFTMAVKADGQPADIVALGCPTELKCATIKAIEAELEEMQPEMKATWKSHSKYDPYRLQVGPLVFPLQRVLHITWE